MESETAATMGGSRISDLLGFWAKPCLGKLSGSSTTFNELRDRRKAPRGDRTQDLPVTWLTPYPLRHGGLKLEPVQDRQPHYLLGTFVRNRRKAPSGDRTQDLQVAWRTP
ncbi:hypothetical protein DPMN_189726 [Dreissena polymorpha]|uniref:Uncharacterized protein n=1 Tax=Dreissena polymorpha TaxID=45954 RepID=A0A9D4DW11_DREPO|nr:hypothetical protein DPMN_189726 [Dreissena polymorpha]